jgi:hypothetical protein
MRIKSSPNFIIGDRCQEFWSAPLLSPLEDGMKVPSLGCGDLCSSFHVVCREGIKLTLGKHFRQIA